MRQIKFRAWDSKNDVMRDWDYIRTSWTLSILNGDSRTEIMQFTGLHDKNGKEIYEGDVIQTLVEETRLSNFVVSFDEFRASFVKTRLNGQKDTHPMDLRSENNKEIIGNIYENPELLKP